MTHHIPEILAPAGDRKAFLAGLAAGADAIYCGLKHFSARMAADNFSITDLAGLAELAREMGSKTYLAFNVLLKPGDIQAAGRLIDRLTNQVRPEAIIVQDLGMVDLARQAGYAGEIHLSTLANVSFGRALPFIQDQLDVSRVVLPRELSIDEIKSAAGLCPPGMGLEVFVHGALCYAVSGRCYWSSFLGGKSGLRGRCVQPCRRVYAEGRQKKGRLFSCLDLGLDVLTKTLLPVEAVKAWKIEGRKKSAHYVYYTVRAYRILRDEGGDPTAKKAAQDLLEQSLGRKTTHYFFLPQRRHQPVQPDEQTGSGLFAGMAKCTKKVCSLRARFDLQAEDLLRIGYEDQAGHAVFRVRNYVRKGNVLNLGHRKFATDSAPVFLIDRTDSELRRLLQSLSAKLGKLPAPEPESSDFTPLLPEGIPTPPKPATMHLHRTPPSGKGPAHLGLWLVPGGTRKIGRPLVKKVWWWLPPAIWPEEEAKWGHALDEACRRGARRFVLNAPWQRSLLPRLEDLVVWAGPFCNTANPLAVAGLEHMGFAGAIVSPELTGEDYLALPKHSPLPLGIVTKGIWPLCISRTLARQVRPDTPLASPKGEMLWVHRFGPNLWLFPNWPLDLSEKTDQLRDAGYSFFMHIHEHMPKSVTPADRTSTFNWDLKLL